jgi:hypothetical protein
VGSNPQGTEDFCLWLGLFQRPRFSFCTKIKDHQFQHGLLLEGADFRSNLCGLIPTPRHIQCFNVGQMNPRYARKYNFYY